MIKISLILSPKKNERLEEMAASLGITKSELLRRGIDLLEIVHDAKKQNHSLAITTANKKIVAQIIGL
jgi:hypothetical protein